MFAVGLLRKGKEEAERNLSVNANFTVEAINIWVPANKVAKASFYFKVLFLFCCLKLLLSLWLNINGTFGRRREELPALRCCLQ